MSLPKSKKKAFVVIIPIIVLALVIVFFASLLRKATKAEYSSPRLFGATYMTMNNPFFQVLNNSISDIVEANGDILITRDPARDQEKQNQQIKEMVDEGIVILFLNPVDWKGVTPALELCQQAGVTVINIDTAVYRTDLVLCTIESDNFSAGQLCAQNMVVRKKEARILLLNSVTTDSIYQRMAGFLSVIDDLPQYQVVKSEPCEGELEFTMEKVIEIIEAGYDFDVIMSGNDPTALGALAALQQTGYENEVLIYGVDGSPDFMSLLKEGLVQGTGLQSPKNIGAVAVENAYSYLKGEEIEKRIIIPVRLITRNNIDEIGVIDWQ